MVAKQIAVMLSLGALLLSLAWAWRSTPSVSSIALYSGLFVAICLAIAGYLTSAELDLKVWMRPIRGLALWASEKIVRTVFTVLIATTLTACICLLGPCSVREFTITCNRADEVKITRFDSTSENAKCESRELQQNLWAPMGELMDTVLCRTPSGNVRASKVDDQNATMSCPTWRDQLFFCLNSPAGGKEGGTEGAGGIVAIVKDLRVKEVVEAGELRFVFDAKKPDKLLVLNDPNVSSTVVNCIGQLKTAKGSDVVAIIVVPVTLKTQIEGNAPRDTSISLEAGSSCTVDRTGVCDLEVSMNDLSKPCKMRVKNALYLDEDARFDCDMKELLRGNAVFPLMPSREWTIDATRDGRAVEAAKLQLSGIEPRGAEIFVGECGGIDVSACTKTAGDISVNRGQGRFWTDRKLTALTVKMTEREGRTIDRPLKKEFKKDSGLNAILDFQIRGNGVVQLSTNGCSPDVMREIRNRLGSASDLSLPQGPTSPSTTLVIKIDENKHVRSVSAQGGQASDLRPVAIDRLGDRPFTGGACETTILWN